MWQQELVPYYEASDEPVDVQRSFPVLLRIDAEKCLPAAKKHLEVGEVLGRLGACNHAIGDHGTIACTWLCNRYSDERNIRVASFAESREIRWRGRGEQLCAVTEVSIW